MCYYARLRLSQQQDGGCDFISVLIDNHGGSSEWCLQSLKGQFCLVLKQDDNRPE